MSYPELVNFTDLLEAVYSSDIVPTSMALPEKGAGGTGYLDGIQPEDVTSAVSMGTDTSGRRFLAIALTVDGLRRNNEYEYVETIFERYTPGHGPSVLTSGGGCVLTHSAMDRDDLVYLQRILRREPVGQRRYEFVTTVTTVTTVTERGFVLLGHGHAAAKLETQKLPVFYRNASKREHLKA